MFDETKEGRFFGLDHFEVVSYEDFPKHTQIVATRFWVRNKCNKMISYQAIDETVG